MRLIALWKKQALKGTANARWFELIWCSEKYLRREQDLSKESLKKVFLRNKYGG